MRRLGAAALGGVAVVALAWAAIGLADEITCNGGKCNGANDKADDSCEEVIPER